MILSSLASSPTPYMLIFLEAGSLLFMLFFFPLFLFWQYRQFLIHKTPLWKAAPITLLIAVSGIILFFLWSQYGDQLYHGLPHSKDTHSFFVTTTLVMSCLPEFSYLIFTILLVIIALKERKSQNPT